MKAFKNILKENKREYKFKIKLTYKISEKDFTEIKDYLSKYDLISITDPVLTSALEHPFDFYDMEHKEVYVIDVTIGVAVPSYYVQQDIKTALACPEKYIVVRSPYEWQEYQRYEKIKKDEIDAEAAKKGLTKGSLLSTDGYYDAETFKTAELFYGDVYNNNLKTYLAKVAKERVLPEIPPQIVKQGLFAWIKDIKPDVNSEDFNKNIKDAPKVISKNDDISFKDILKVKQEEDTFKSDNDHIFRNMNMFKAFINKAGDTVVIEKE